MHSLLSLTVAVLVVNLCRNIVAGFKRHEQSFSTAVPALYQRRHYDWSVDVDLRRKPSLVIKKMKKKPPPMKVFMQPVSSNNIDDKNDEVLMDDVS
jgi:hypothetical protein